MNKNIYFQNHSITKQKREKKYGHKTVAVWFTGLSGSGKTSIANLLETVLFKNNIKTYLLDGDNIRSGLCADLDFSISGRKENMRRISEVVKIMLDAGILVLIAAISPYSLQREKIRCTLKKENFLEIFVDTPIHICESRDPKKLYQQSRIGKISDFTGIHSIYEVPKNPDIHLDGTKALQYNVDKVIKILYTLKIISFA